MNAYQRNKNNARGKAIEWQLDFDNHSYTYEELVYWTKYFDRLAVRYGLVNEFRENGII